MINATIFGRLGKDPETRTAGQTSVTSFSVAATHYAGKGKGDNNTDYTATWVQVSVWGSRGQSLQTRLKKGSRVVASGELYEEAWTGKNGQSGKSIKLNANDVQIVDWDQAGSSSSAGTTQNRNTQPAPADDIPY